MSLNGAPLATVLNSPAFKVVAVTSSSPATKAGIASAPSAKYFRSASRLTFSKNLRASAINIGPEEIRRTSPILILVGFSWARMMAGAETAKESAAVPARRRRRSIFILILPFATAYADSNLKRKALSAPANGSARRWQPCRRDRKVAGAVDLLASSNLAENRARLKRDPRSGRSHQYRASASTSGAWVQYVAAEWGPLAVELVRALPCLTQGPGVVAVYATAVPTGCRHDRAHCAGRDSDCALRVVWRCLCADGVALHDQPVDHPASAGTIQPCASRRRPRHRLSLLPRLGRNSGFRRHAADHHLHDLSFATLHQCRDAGASAHELGRA